MPSCARPVLQFFTLVALVAMMVASQPAPVVAQTFDTPSGLPLPRFVSIRNAPVNVRVGPGTRYEIAWVFVKPGLPVEIVQEFDTWRKIRDFEGEEGWLHQGLLVGTRTALVTPWATEGQVAMRTRETADSPVRAWLSPGLLVEVRQCDGTMCEVRLQHAAGGERMTTFAGFVEQGALWGVYANEVFD